MTTITVGPGEQYSTISAAVAASSGGDTIDVDAGTYTNDFPEISHDLTLQAVGGTVTMVATQQPSNGKGIIDEGGSGVNVTINGFDISGAQVSDDNGAGIRYEGGSLTLNGDTIHNNQDGLLSNPDPNGTITINGSTFRDNGTGDGGTHNIYVGDINSLTVQNSTIDDAVVGHDIKSRAQNTTITNNTIEDGPNGNSSYEIDLPNGGNANIQGNVIEKGPNAQNPSAISFGEEGGVYADSSLLVQNNTMLNDYTAHSTDAVVNDTGTTATVAGNSLYGWTTIASGPANVSGNTILTTEPALSSLIPGGTAGGSGGGTGVADTSSTPAAATTSGGTSTTPAATTTSGGTSSTPAATTTGDDTGTTPAAATTSDGTGSTPAAPSTGTAGTPSDTGSTVSASDTSSGTGTASQGGGAPVSTTTVGSSSSSPTFIAGSTGSGGDGQQGGGSGTATTTQTTPSLGASGLAELVASLAAHTSATSLAFPGGSPSSSALWNYLNGLSSGGGSTGDQSPLQLSSGGGAQLLTASSGQQNASGLLAPVGGSTT